MDFLLYVVLGLGITWGLYLLYIQVATRAAEGRPADPLYDEFPALASLQGKALVYCYSPQCGPCRPMSAAVDGLIAQGTPLYKLDIAERPALAHELGIRATPTLILIEDGTIARMMIGAKTAGYMQQLVATQAAR